MIILVVNLLSGYLFGYLYSFTNSDIVKVATDKVDTWSFSSAFFIKSMLCGVIMYICVYLYKKGTKLGILLGIPLFIFAGFQHCIANIITLGIAHRFHDSLVLCIIGNFLGSLFMWYVSKAAESRG